MESARVLDEFDRLVQEADRLEENYLTPLPEREAVHEAALTLVLQHPEMRVEFATKFGEMIRKHDLELFEYCLHELRWPEVLAQLDAEVRNADDTRDWRAHDYLARAKFAFTDQWSGRGFYKRFPS